MKTKIKIGVADDHALIRKAVAKLLSSMPEFEIIMESDNGVDFLEQLLERVKNKSGLPDIVLADINMQMMDGLTLTARLKESYPTIKVIMLTMYFNDMYILKSIRTGACGYLPKNTEMATLKTAIETVYNKGLYFPENVTNTIIRAVQQGTLEDSTSASDAVRWDLLNETEKSFIRLSASDFSYAEISKKLKIEPTYTETLRQTMFKRFNVKTRVSLALMAQKNGFLDESN